MVYDLKHIVYNTTESISADFFKLFCCCFCCTNLHCMPSFFALAAPFSFNLLWKLLYETLLARTYIDGCSIKEGR